MSSCFLQISPIPEENETEEAEEVEAGNDKEDEEAPEDLAEVTYQLYIEYSHIFSIAIILQFSEEKMCFLAFWNLFIPKKFNSTHFSNKDEQRRYKHSDVNESGTVNCDIWKH